VGDSGHGDLPASLGIAMAGSVPEAPARRLQATLFFAYEIHYFYFTKLAPRQREL
jgi:hypothetical protein